MVVYTTNYYGTNNNYPFTGPTKFNTYTVPVGRLYPTREDCVQIVILVWILMESSQIKELWQHTGVNITGSGSRAQDWCNAIKDELQNQFGNLWTSADSTHNLMTQTQQPPSNYSPIIILVGILNIKICMGRISSVWKYNSIEKMR